MPAINFKQRYAAAILDGSKCQTIRAPRVDHRPHAQPGDRLALYTGMRTKGCRKLMDAVCVSRQQIVITETPAIIVDGTPVRDEDGFARADGFDNFADFLDFFDNTYGLPFEGTLIKWRPVGPDAKD